MENLNLIKDIPRKRLSVYITLFAIILVLQLANLTIAFGFHDKLIAFVTNTTFWSISLLMQIDIYRTNKSKIVLGLMFICAILVLLSLSVLLGWMH